MGILNAPPRRARRRAKGKMMFDWLQEHAGRVATAAAGAVAVPAGYLWPLLTAMSLAIASWSLSTTIELKTAIAANAVKNDGQDERVSALEKRLSDDEVRMLATTDDRWRRRDHDTYAALIENRLQQMDARIQAQRDDLNMLRRAR